MDARKLIVALSNKDVTDAFAAAILPAIITTIDEKMSDTVTELKSVIDSLREEIKSTNIFIDNLVAQNDSLRYRLDALEIYTRVDNLIIKGLPETFAEITTPHRITTSENSDLRSNSNSTLNDVLHLCNDSLGIKVEAADISINHRLGKFDQKRPVIVRFTNRHVQGQAYVAQKELRQVTHQPHAICINKHLTKINEQFFSACRKLWKEKKIAGTWTWHGITYAKMHSNRMLKITSPDDINKLN